jgi:hypothetical protein
MIKLGGRDRAQLVVFAYQAAWSPRASPGDPIRASARSRYVFPAIRGAACYWKAPEFDRKLSGQAYRTSRSE